MLKALGLKSSTPSKKDSEKERQENAVRALEEAIALENGLRAMDLVMDDRPDEAQKILSGGNSTYYKLARGVVHFIEATIGFEADAIKQAVDSLHEAEAASNKERQRAVKNKFVTSSFPPGTEYALTYAEANLMGAISLFLSESVIDAAKAFLKLRKAYQALDELYKVVGPSIPTNKTRTGSIVVHKESLTDVLSRVSLKLTKTKSQSSLQTTGTNVTTATGRAASVNSAKLSELQRTFYEAHLERLGRISTKSPSSTLIEEYEEPTGPAGAESIDEFIVSGVNCMFGILQLVLSIIPPTLGKVMSIVGFRGDRDEGLKMLWKSADSTNIHGAIALLALLQFFDGPTQFADISLDSGKEENGSAQRVSSSGEPKAYAPQESQVSFFSQDDLRRVKSRLSEGLARIRSHYSHGALWQLQEGRMAAQTDLVEAVKIMDDKSNGPIQMKQVEGLMIFDKSIMMIVLHMFEEASENFVNLIDLSTWSHALYMYLAGACHVEIYRKNITSNPELAAASKKTARDYMLKAPTMMGKRKFMAKAMPFDVFVSRKVTQWQKLAAEKDIDLIDAIGTSPIHEAMYFWNGFSRMPKTNLEAALESLGYSGDPGRPFASDVKPILEETETDRLTRGLLQSITLRSLGRKEEGLALLEKEVIPKVYASTKGLSPNGVPVKVHYLKHSEEPWSGPSSIYERAIFEFQIHGPTRAAATREYLDLAANWDEDYELSTRVGMKIKSARDKLESYSL